MTASIAEIYDLYISLSSWSTNDQKLIIVPIRGTLTDFYCYYTCLLRKPRFESRSVNIKFKSDQAGISSWFADSLLKPEGFKLIKQYLTTEPS